MARITRRTHKGLRGYTASGGWQNPESSELRLYIDNDYPLYKFRQAIDKNLQKKCVRGIFDPIKAEKAFLYLTNEGARRYDKEFGSPRRKGQPYSIPMDARKEVARDYVESFLAENPGCLGVGRK